MKRTIKSLIGYAMGAHDGAMGTVKDFYFDDKTWLMRYLILTTRDWLPGRKFLISTEAVLSINTQKEIFAVNLTKEQIRTSPDINFDKPVSRQQEEELFKHYPWQPYWNRGIYMRGVWGVSGKNPIMTEEVIKHDINHNDNHKSDIHLCSVKDAIGFQIHGPDGEIGTVADFIIDNRNWKVNFIVIDAGKGFSEREVIIETRFIKKINWEDSSVAVSLLVGEVSNSPHYDASKDIKLFENSF